MSSAQAQLSRGSAFRAAAGRQWRAFGGWRRQRPFWAGLLILLSGLPILYFPYADLHLAGLTMRMSTTAGAGSLIIGLLLIVLGLTVWFQPLVRVFAGVAAIVLALVSLVVSNFGGFGIGLILGLVGGALALSWSFDSPPNAGPGDTAHGDTANRQDAGDGETAQLGAVQEHPEEHTEPSSQGADAGHPDTGNPDAGNSGVVNPGADPRGGHAQDSFGNALRTVRRVAAGAWGPRTADHAKRRRTLRLASVATLPTALLLAGVAPAIGAGGGSGGTPAGSSSSGSSGANHGSGSAGTSGGKGASKDPFASGPCATSSPSSRASATAQDTPGSSGSETPSSSSSDDAPSAGPSQHERGQEHADGSASPSDSASTASPSPTDGRSGESGSTGKDSGTASSDDEKRDGESPSADPSPSSSETHKHPVKDFFDDLFSNKHQDDEDEGQDEEQGKGQDEEQGEDSTSPSPSSSSEPGSDAGEPGKRGATGQQGTRSDSAAPNASPSSSDSESPTPGASPSPGASGASPSATQSRTTSPSPSSSARESSDPSPSISGVPCPVKTKGKVTHENSIEFGKHAWHLDSSKLTLYGLKPEGVVKVNTAAGAKEVLKFTATGIDIRDLKQTVPLGNGKTFQLTSNKGSTSTFRDGPITMYTEEISGKMLGILPITMSPDGFHLPKLPFRLPIPVFFTDAKVDQAGQVGGTIKIPGMTIDQTDGK